MKYKLTGMAILLIVGGLASAYKKDPDFIRAIQKGAKARIVLSVVDDEGAVVPDAAVRALMGMNFRERAYHINGLTDSDGRFAVEGKTTGDEVEVEISKDGYYGTSKKYCFITMGAESNVKDGKWQPFGMEERLRLRKIRNPVKLRRLGFGNGRIMPATNKWLSCRVTLRFTEPLSGGYYSRNVSESAYPYPYEAQAGADYEIRALDIAASNIKRGKDGVLFPRDAVLVTRTRCVLDEKGQLKSAHYGYVWVAQLFACRRCNPGMRLAWVFNPTPNDTNLEPAK